MSATRTKLLALAAIVTLGMPGARAQTAPAMPPEYRLKPFVLPVPMGRHAVGTTSFVIPVANTEPLRVTAWYPAAAPTGRLHPYLAADEQRVQAPAVARNFAWPTRTLEAVAALPTHSHVDAPPALGRFPVIVFSHGFLSYARQNTALMERLASDGYILLSLTHPGDAADVPTRDDVLRTVSMTGGKQPDLAPVLAFFNGADHPARARAFPGFWTAMDGTRMLNSLARWRRDIVLLASAWQQGDLPAAARPIAAASDLRKLAFAGMSFGGSASASACQIERHCRAAINLDGFEFDRQLHDVRPRMPLLLIQSDWTVYPNMGRPSTDFTLYDYAYRRWSDAGDPPGVYRFRIAGLKHLGLTDLALAAADPVRDGMFGPADGRAVSSAINDLVASFLDQTLLKKGRGVVVASRRHAVVSRHRPTALAETSHR